MRLVARNEARRFGWFTAAQNYLDEAEREKGAWSKEDEAWLALHRTILAKTRGDLEATIHWGEQARRVATERGGIPPALHLADALLENGRFAEARDVLLPAAAAFERRHERGFAPEAESRLARAYLGLGDVGRARECVARARQELLPDDYESVQSVGLAAAALAEADARPQDAERSYRETIVAIDRFGAIWFVLARTYVEFATFLIGQRRFAEARELLSKARDFYRDPLAAKRREQIDALLARCEVPAG